MTAREQGTELGGRVALHAGDRYGLLLLRVGLGGVLVWFGAAELHDPASWAVFVPKMFHPVLAPLMFVHATSLLVAGALLVVGMFHRVAAWLGGLILLAILGALVLTGSVDSVFVRDVGLAAAAFALALSPTARRAPGIDSWLAARPRSQYAVPAVSYGVVLAACVTVLALTAVPLNSSSASAMSNLGSASGLSVLGGSSGSKPSASSGAAGVSLGGSAGTATSGCKSSSSSSAAACGGQATGKGSSGGSAASASAGGLGSLGAVSSSGSHP